MAKLIKPVSDENRKSVAYQVRLNQAEAIAIRRSALMRNLSVAEFIRRAALGRKADVRYETEIVLALREVTQAIRKMHADFVEAKILPVEFEEWRVVIKQATEAMGKVSNL